jgi:hypothetical protein
MMIEATPRQIQDLNAHLEQLVHQVDRLVDELADLTELIRQKQNRRDERLRIKGRVLLRAAERADDRFALADDRMAHADGRLDRELLKEQLERQEREALDAWERVAAFVRKHPDSEHAHEAVAKHWREDDDREG